MYSREGVQITTHSSPILWPVVVYAGLVYNILIFLPKKREMQKEKKCRTVHARGPWMHMFAPTVSRSIYNYQTVLAKSQQRAKIMTNHIIYFLTNL